MKKYREENWRVRVKHWIALWSRAESAAIVLELVLLEAVKKGAGH